MNQNPDSTSRKQRTSSHEINRQNRKDSIMTAVTLFIRRRIDNQIYSGSDVRPVTQLINWQLMKSITIIIYCINNMQNITHWEKKHA